MRLPKFRCKNKVGNWCFFTVLHNGNVNEENFDLDTLSEFTGLLDKQGVEIYEGDILSFEKFDDEVVIFKYGAFGYGNRHFVSLYQTNSICEVIGNIYESPELLDEK